MFVKAKIIDTEGNEKGRAYTYESDFDVEIGDKVIADMAGSDKVLKIVSFAEPHDYENVDFEIKKLKSVYTGEADSDGVLPESTIDISVESVMPVIRISNFETLKTELTKKVDTYKNLVVTEKTLPGCKATQKELAGLRIKVDNYRKDKKKELSAPITAFEEECKSLIQIIESVEQPIKDGIKVFDDMQKDGKRMAAVKILAEIAEKHGLSTKYAARLDVTERYCNLTAKEIDIRTDAETRAFALKAEQDREQEMLEIIQDCIDTENKNIKTQIQFGDFERMIDRMPVKDILAEIKARAKTIYDAENRPAEPPKETQTTITSEEPVAVEQTALETESLHFAVYRIVGTEKELKSVSSYLRVSGIQYSVTEQGEI